MLFPVFPAQEILPREFALSERCGLLEVRYIDTGDAVLAGLVGHFFGDHLADERNRDSGHAMGDFFSAGNGSAIEIGSPGIRSGGVLAGLRYELLQAHGDELRYPFLNLIRRLRCIEVLPIDPLKECRHH